MFREKFNFMRSRKSGYITKYSALSKLGKRSELSKIWHFKKSLAMLAISGFEDYSKFISFLIFFYMFLHFYSERFASQLKKNLL